MKFPNCILCFFDSHAVSKHCIYPKNAVINESNDRIFLFMVFRIKGSCSKTVYLEEFRYLCNKEVIDVIDRELCV